MNFQFKCLISGFNYILIKKENVQISLSDNIFPILIKKNISAWQK